MDSNPNNDVVTEILLRLPFTSLLRLRSVCKSWRDEIDSGGFRKLHIEHKADSDDDKLLVQFSFRRDGVSELSMFSQHTGKLYNTFPTDAGRLARIAGPANGLICIYYTGSDSDASIAVCNPSLCDIRILPTCPSFLGDAFPAWWFRDVGIWYDKVTRDYLVVQLLSCYFENGQHLHASLYSRSTNSWRRLAIAGHGLSVVRPIKSSCKNSSLSHWLAVSNPGKKVILSFDFRNEGFRI